MQNQLLNTQQAAEFLGVSVAFLERDRWAGARVPYIKVGSRAVRYQRSDLEQYILSCRRLSAGGDQND
jgi:predicted DNA-binding transcriptional regulator AlpA